MTSPVGNCRGAAYIIFMTDDEFDAKLVAAAFELGAESGWRTVSAAAAARHAGLDLAAARHRFTGQYPVLRRFGQLADAYALTGALQDGAPRDRLFDILLRRFDFLQLHRAGVAALLRGLPFDPVLAAWLARANLLSMGWLLEGAGLSAQGVRGELRKRGLLAVWAWSLRSWLNDDSADLAATMAAVDVALTRAEQVASRFSPNAAASMSAEPEPSAELSAELPLEPIAVSDKLEPL